VGTLARLLLTSSRKRGLTFIGIAGGMGIALLLGAP
jgi:hypothetical protein